jgi:hypothetical protein
LFFHFLVYLQTSHLFEFDYNSKRFIFLAFIGFPIEIFGCFVHRSQPPLDVIRNLAKVLQVSADELVFGENERQSSDDLKC